jgi:hypothetical protein
MQNSIIAAAILALGLPAAAQQTITCSSRNGGTNFCPADTSNGVMLLEEHSNGVCEQGSTWKYTNRGIVVNSGCSADFQVGGGRGNNANSGYGTSNRQNRGNPNDNNQNSYSDTQNSDNNTNDRYGDRQQTGMSIPAGTRLDVRLEQTVNAAEVNAGEVIPATLVNDLSVDGRVLASAGTPVQAKVVSAHGEPLDVRLDSMSVGGRRYKLISNSIHSAKDARGTQDGQNVTAGDKIGSVVGALTGGDQMLRSGSVYTFRLTSPSRPIRMNQ